MTHTGRQIRQRFGNRGIVIAVAVVAAAIVAGIVVLAVS